MWLNPQETPALVTITEEILNGKLHFLYGDTVVDSDWDASSYRVYYLKN